MAFLMERMTFDNLIFLANYVPGLKSIHARHQLQKQWVTRNLTDSDPLSLKHLYKARTRSTR